TGLIEEGVRLLLDRLVTPEMRDFNFDAFYGSDVPATRVLDIACAYPMLAAYRTVLVRDVHKMPAGDLLALAEYAKKPCPTTHLILTQREKGSKKKGLEVLSKIAGFVDCRPLYDNQIVPWIQSHIASLGMTISPEAAQWLATEVGNSIQALRSEIDKLQTYLGSERQITLEHVREVAGFRREFSVFSLQEALGGRNLAAALRIVEVLAENTSPGAIVSSLARYFGQLYLAQTLSRRQDLAVLSQKTGVHAFFAERLQREARAYSSSALFNALEVLRHVDYLAKSQSISAPLLLRLMTIAIIKQLPVQSLPFPRVSANELLEA
ncbi:MAG: DNA polymerase III subunit delta, partial [candidate division KSB1 bacterium]|nr:DNA polymerase III subunit delta [candidate division KSB1 bacterium]